MDLRFGLSVRFGISGFFPPIAYINRTKIKELEKFSDKVKTRNSGKPVMKDRISNNKSMHKTSEGLNLGQSRGYITLTSH